MCSESCAWLAATMFGSCTCEGCFLPCKQPSHIQLPNMVAASQAQLSLHMQFWNRTTDKQLLLLLATCFLQATITCTAARCGAPQPGALLTAQTCAVLTLTPYMQTPDCRAMFAASTTQCLISCPSTLQHQTPPTSMSTKRIAPTCTAARCAAPQPCALLTAVPCAFLTTVDAIHTAAEP
jgi:hypothetical protein